MYDDDPLTVYLAGPVGHADDGGVGWRSQLVATFGHEYDFENPLSKYNVPLEGLAVVPGSVSEQAQEQGAVGVDDIVEGDKAMLEECDAVLVGYEPVRSIGTPMEVMWAYERDYPIAMWIRDGPVDMEALSPWYRYHVDAISSSAGDALSALEVFSGQRGGEPPEGYERGSTEHGVVAHFVDYDTDSMLALGNGDPDAALCGRTGDFDHVDSDRVPVCRSCAEKAADGVEL